MSKPNQLLSLDKILENIKTNSYELEQYQIDKSFFPTHEDLDNFYKIRAAGIDITGLASVMYYTWGGST